MAKPVMWLETVTTPMSRSATPAVDSGTYRKAARRSNATGRPYRYMFSLDQKSSFIQEIFYTPRVYCVNVNIKS